MLPALIPFSQTLLQQIALSTGCISRRISSSKPNCIPSFPRREDLSLMLLSNPQELLDQLSACLHFLSYIPNSLLVSVSALSRLAHIQFTWPGFLDKVKIAAGKSGSDESKRDARSWLSTRIAEDPISARSTLVHAGQLNALLMRFTFE